MPSPCWHLPLGFLRQRREQSCLLCCFTPHQLHFPHLKGQGKAPFQDAARADPAVFCVPARHFPNLAAFGHWEQCGYTPAPLPTNGLCFSRSQMDLTF